MLAGEISRSPTNIPFALAQYEKVTRTYVSKAQKTFPGAPQIANPQTAWGVRFFNAVTGVMAHPYAKMAGSMLGKWLPAFGPTTVWDVPEYGGRGV